MAELNARGHEVLDPTPMAIPVGFKTPETLTEQIRRFVRQELSVQASAAGHESFEEADDFEIEDDDGYDPRSPWELDFDQENAPRPTQASKNKSGRNEHSRRNDSGDGSSAQPDSKSGKTDATSEKQTTVGNPASSDAGKT